MKFVKKHWTILSLLGIWLLATAFNITKAVHIDDYSYIEWATKYLTIDPFHPLSAKISVYPNSSLTMQDSFHPPLIPYLYALVISIFGDSLLLLHIVLSLFTLTSVIFFFLLAKIVVKKNALVLTSLFILSPVFLPSQNLMLDIPSVSLSLIFFYLLFSAGNEEFDQKFYVFGGLIAGIACLVKYSNLILIFFMAIDIVLHKRWQLIHTLFTPIFILIIWSVFNYLDYGGIHLLGSISASRINGGIFLSPDKLFSWIITLGAVMPFSIVFLPGVVRKKRNLIFLVCCLALIIFYYFRIFQGINELPINTILRIYFLSNGIFTCGLALGIAVKQFPRYLMLLLWLVCTSIYLIISVPFMAVRHLLPVMPAIILLFGLYLSKIKSPRLLYIGLLLTIILGFCLGLSDWLWADTVRSQVNEITRITQTYHNNSGSTVRIWNAGYYDWGYYGKRSGMIYYENDSKPQNGDFLVMPSVFWLQPINAQDLPYFQIKERIVTNRSFLTFLSLICNYPFNLEGFYYLPSRNSLPFCYSTAPLGEVILYQYQIQ